MRHSTNLAIIIFLASITNVNSSPSIFKHELKDAFISLREQQDLKGNGVLAVDSRLGTNPSYMDIWNGGENAHFQEIFTDDQTEVPEDMEVPEHCTKEVYKIHSSGDIAALADCETITGSLVFENYQDPVIDFGDIVHVAGNVKVANSSHVVRVISNKLSEVGGMLSLEELTSLTSVYFPMLVAVDQLEWKILPILSTVNLDAGISKIRSITISDTSLVGFTGFEVDLLDILNINNNRFLESVTSNVRKISQELLISANAKYAEVRFPSLKFANNMTFNDVSMLDLSNIELVENSASFINNKFSALKIPKLKEIGGTLSISKNTGLSSVELPTLGEVGGGLIVMDNALLQKLNFFPKLSVIGGAIEFTGNIKEATLAKLKLVKGSAIVQSTAAAFDCSKWTKGDMANTIRGGRIECTGGMAQEDMMSYDNSNRSIHRLENDAGIRGGLKQALSSSGYLSCLVNIIYLFASLFLAAVMS
ncbi:hypothetical protein BABINDRAFT_161219 [Babjeviella inositovora NRRL Y-12698]|uniref:Receptor L-domain domain-containing protein n=1 Tax=Babjeviella inositovora NRRL Y-12698 TaxID=984486 RepID=A0A1E3QRB3_9ASCO|nr:uncharacterized protein BABINDRAFT_161219 [Babjeviella inositovora NRRL Y-12698]ODQ80256.1 hypothetical protein BABINDRAFT_161219 [Babjeviella inositovora NRRL Y-12698]